MGLSWAKLGSNWHLKAILTSSCRLGRVLAATWPTRWQHMRLKNAKMRFWRHLGALWGGPWGVLGGPGGVLEGSWAVKSSSEG